MSEDRSNRTWDGKPLPERKTWQVQEAKARFSELLERTAVEGPQVVTRRGVETAVVVPFEQWRRLQRPRAPRDVLLEAGPRVEQLVPPRQEWRQRPAPRFE